MLMSVMGSIIPQLTMKDAAIVVELRSAYRLGTAIGGDDLPRHGESFIRSGLDIDFEPHCRIEQPQTSQEKHFKRAGGGRTVA